MTRALRHPASPASPRDGRIRTMLKSRARGDDSSVASSCVACVMAPWNDPRNAHRRTSPRCSHHFVAASSPHCALAAAGIMRTSRARFDAHVADGYQAGRESPSNWLPPSHQVKSGPSQCENHFRNRNQTSYGKTEVPCGNFAVRDISPKSNLTALHPGPRRNRTEPG